MKVLITGANGFLGSNTVRHLLNANYEILALSKNSNNISDIIHRIDFIKCNSENYFLHESKILDFCPNIVINFAWDGGNNYQDINSFNQFYKNIPLSLSLLEINISLFLYPAPPIITIRHFITGAGFFMHRTFYF